MPRNIFASARWPELLTGRNSVKPCTRPRMIVSVFICSFYLMFLNFAAPPQKSGAHRRRARGRYGAAKPVKIIYPSAPLNIRYKRYDGRIIARTLRENLAYPLAYLRRQSLALRARRAPRTARQRSARRSLKLAEGAAVVSRIYASARLYLHRRRGLHRSVKHDGDDDEAVLRHFAPARAECCPRTRRVRRRL